MLERALILGVCCFALVRLVRAFPRVQDWVLEGRKPWACDTCASSWAAIVLSLVLLADPTVSPLTELDVGRLFAWLSTGGAAAGTCMAMLALLERVPPPMPNFLPGGDDDFEGDS